MPLGGAYRLLVANVRDRHGNVQTQPVQLTLSTGPLATIVQESSPPDLASTALTPPRRVIQPTDRPAKRNFGRCRKRFPPDTV